MARQLDPRPWRRACTPACVCCVRKMAVSLRAMCASDTCLSTLHDCREWQLALTATPLRKLPLAYLLSILDGAGDTGAAYSNFARRQVAYNSHCACGSSGWHSASNRLISCARTQSNCRISSRSFGRPDASLFRRSSSLLSMNTGTPSSAVSRRAAQASPKSTPLMEVRISILFGGRPS